MWSKFIWDTSWHTGNTSEFIICPRIGWTRWPDLMESKMNWHLGGGWLSKCIYTVAPQSFPSRMRRLRQFRVDQCCLSRTGNPCPGPAVSGRHALEVCPLRPGGPRSFFNGVPLSITWLHHILFTSQGPQTDCSGLPSEICGRIDHVRHQRPALAPWTRQAVGKDKDRRGSPANLTCSPPPGSTPQFPTDVCSRHVTITERLRTKVSCRQEIKLWVL